MYALRPFHRCTERWLSNYERLPYEEALILSTQVHQEAQQANKRFSSEFRIFDDADQLVYKGIFQFG